MPSRWRDQLADGVVLAKGLDASVWVFTPAGYEEFSKGFLSKASPLNKKGLMLRRHFHGARFDDKLDSAGRIRIPKILAEHAGVAEGPAVVVGSEDWFEIWNPGKWTTYQEAIDAELAELAESYEEES